MRAAGRDTDTVLREIGELSADGLTAPRQKSTRWSNSPVGAPSQSSSRSRRTRVRDQPASSSCMLFGARSALQELAGRGAGGLPSWRRAGVDAVTVPDDAGAWSPPPRPPPATYRPRPTVARAFSGDRAFAIWWAISGRRSAPSSTIPGTSASFDGNGGFRSLGHDVGDPPRDPAPQLRITSRAASSRRRTSSAVAARAAKACCASSTPGGRNVFSTPIFLRLSSNMATTAMAWDFRTDPEYQASSTGSNVRAGGDRAARRALPLSVPGPDPAAIIDPLKDESASRASGDPPRADSGQGFAS